MKNFFCDGCGETTTHKPFHSNMFKYNGETVRTCKKCGDLRTGSELRIPESEIRHKVKNKKLKELKRDEDEPF